MRESDLPKLDKPFGLLRRQSGITLVEALVLVVVLAVSVLTIYIGIVYAEKMITRNYRDRVATLLVTGELEMEYYRHSRSKPFELQVNKAYVLDDRDPDNVLWGYMTIEKKSGQESSNEQLLSFVYLEATFRWIDPSTKKSRFIRMREDYFFV